jgi:hypothetical protein
MLGLCDVLARRASGRNFILTDHLMRKITFYLLLVVVPALFALGLGEIALRITDPSKIRSGWKDIYQLIFVNYQHKQSNQLGYRGKPMNIEPSDFVVLLIGDSQVECLACRDQHLPEDTLQEYLAPLVKNRPVKVFQLGASGYGPDQEFLALRSYFAKGFRADLILLWETLGNDVMDATFPMSSTDFGSGHLKPTFRLDDQGKLVWPASDIGGYFCKFYLECVYRIQRYGSIDAYWEQFLPPPARPIEGEPPAQLPVVDTKDSVEYEKSSWGMVLDPPSPRKLYGIALTRALYKEMQAESARNNAKFVILDVNRRTKEGYAELKNFPQSLPYPQLVRRKGKLYLAGGQAAYLAAGQALNSGFEYVIVEMDRPKHVVSENDPHLNEQGNARVMEQASMILMQRGLIPSQAHSQ